MSEIEQNNRSAMSNSLPQQQGDLEEYIEVLTEHQYQCQQQGKYVEAEMSQQRIKELKQELQKQRREDIKHRHISEKMGIEKSHLEEFNQFNEFWDKKMQEFDEEANKIKDDLIFRQGEEFQSVQQELEKTIPMRPKESSEILNLRRIEGNLARQKNYKEAHQVQQKIKILEKQEQQQWLQQRQLKIKNQLNQLKQRQNNELNALTQRIFAGQDEQRKSRSIELERLLQKYQNVKKELESQSEKEVLSFNKQFKSKVSLGQSRYGGSQMVSRNN